MYAGGNKKVLLHERKRHTAHRVASPWWGVPTLAGGVPTLAGGVPTMAGGGYLPWLGGTYFGWGGGTYLGQGGGVPTLAGGYPPWLGCTHLGDGGTYLGQGTPAGVDKQTN